MSLIILLLSFSLGICSLQSYSYIPSALVIISCFAKARNSHSRSDNSCRGIRVLLPMSSFQHSSSNLYTVLPALFSPPRLPTKPITSSTTPAKPHKLPPFLQSKGSLSLASTTTETASPVPCEMHLISDHSLCVTSEQESIIGPQQWSIPTLSRSTSAQIKDSSLHWSPFVKPWATTTRAQALRCTSKSFPFSNIPLQSIITSVYQDRQIDIPVINLDGKDATSAPSPSHPPSNFLANSISACHYPRSWSLLSNLSTRILSLQWYQISYCPFQKRIYPSILLPSGIVQK
jgi:hypothetical protein